ncbi:MAG TPA: hypothetical protein VJY62_17695 [Bacteroidia bacterium]|nr:hypothetical protein [Bacteroidia bacterium]
MDLSEFIRQYDFKGSIVLLEGKRNVDEADVNQLILLGEILTTKTKYIKFRSGNAEGSDFYFSSGVIKINAERLEVITPYSGHRKKENNAYKIFPLDEINLLQEPEVVYQSKTNKKTGKFIDEFVAGKKNHLTMKAAYIIRDTIKVTGTSTIKPANFALFYDDLKNPKSGGTGHTMSICGMNNVDYVDQETWMKWLNE